MLRDFERALREVRLKATPKRMAILEILAGQPIYLSPDQVWQEMKPRFSKIGLPTVYRNLEDLSQSGVVIKITHPDRRLYYYFCPRATDHHHHFVCVSCRRVEDLNFCGAGDIEREVENTLKGKVLSHLVQVYGLCRKCAGGLSSI